MVGFECFFSDVMGYEYVYRFERNGDVYLQTEQNTDVSLIAVTKLNGEEIRFCVHIYDKLDK